MGQQFITADTIFTINNLHPASGHSFVFYSRSISGISKISTCMLIHFTLCTVPDQPYPVELLKITKNGMLLNWHEPESNNGAKLSLWELEIVDYDSLVNLGLCKIKIEPIIDNKIIALHEEIENNIPSIPESQLGSNIHSRIESPSKSMLSSMSNSPRYDITIDTNNKHHFHRAHENNSIDLNDYDDTEAAMVDKEVIISNAFQGHDNTPYADNYHKICQKQKLDKKQLLYHKVIVHRNLTILRK